MDARKNTRRHRSSRPDTTRAETQESPSSALGPGESFPLYARPVDTIFGVEWENLTVAVIRRFLADAGDEPLRWEAKADGPDRLSAAKVRETICAFANSEQGGYLILGASGGRGDRWELPGLTLAPRDLSAWISQAADHVQPRPAVDIRTFRGAQGRGRIAIVWVPPIGEPPAMTSDGGVFVRVAGASPAVKDPRILAELYGRGVAARVSAEQRSLTALNPGPDNRSSRRIASFGAATIRVTSGQIYRKAYIDALENLARERLQDVVKIASVERVMDHTKTWIRLKSLDGWRAEVEAHRDGSVGIHYWCPQEVAVSPRQWAADPVLLGAILHVIVTALALAGATGRLHLRVSVLNQLSSSASRGTDLARWAESGDPADPLRDGIRRDLLRSMQEWILDPDDQP